MINSFFINKGPFKIQDLLKLSEIINSDNFLDNEISDIKDLSNAKKKNITFFHSKNMKV